MMSSEIININQAVVDLYMMLDNIDTYGDMCKGDYEGFFMVTMKQIAKREKYYKLFEQLKRNMEPVNE